MGARLVSRVRRQGRYWFWERWRCILEHCIAEMGAVVNRATLKSAIDAGIHLSLTKSPPP